MTKLEFYSTNARVFLGAQELKDGDARPVKGGVFNLPGHTDESPKTGFVEAIISKSNRSTETTTIEVIVRE